MFQPPFVKVTKGGRELKWLETFSKEGKRGRMLKGFGSEVVTFYFQLYRIGYTRCSKNF